MKKGFTIIELITVVVLLSLIAVFTFPTVNTTIKNRREALYDIQVDNIKASAISYIDKNGLLKNNDKVIVTLCQLKQNGYSDEKLKNPINGKYIPDDSKVIVTKDDRIFIYGTEDNVSCTITDSTLFEYVEVGSSYKETIDLSKYTIKIYKDNNVVDRIDTSLIGSYFIEYENSNSKIYKYLYIVDTTPPDIKYKDKVNNSYVIGDSIVTLEASQGVFNSYDVVVNDNSGEIITPIVSTNVNLRVPGSYFLTYNATDASLNKVTKTQTIKVVDTFAPTINNVLGNPTSPTSMSAIISVDAFDNGTGLHPLGAYSFDGGNTWQTENSVTVDNNTTLKIVVRDAAGNKSSKNVVINKIVRDDRNISFSINKGTIKNNGWFIDNVDVLVKPLVSEEFFESFSYCTGESVCEPNIVSNKYNGEVVSLTSNTDGVLVCGKVNKKDGTSTDTLCSIKIKIDKGIPSVYYNVLDGKMNSGFEPWYVSNVDLEVKSQSSSGIEKIEYCTTTGSSCSPNKVINGSSPRLTISNNSKTNKVCSIVTNGAGNRSQNTCSINYQIDKTVPSVSISVSGNVDDYIGQNATLTAVVDPTTTVSGYTYYWYKNDTLIQSGSNNTIRINNGPDIYRIDNYKVVVITGAGNQGSSTKTLKVDTIKPTCVLNASGTVGNDGWYISSSVNVTGTFKDSESGILSKGIGTSLGYNDNTTYSVKTNTKGTTVYCSVKDKVGNEGTNSIVIKKDDGSDASCILTGENSSWTNNLVTLRYLATSKVSKFNGAQVNVRQSFSAHEDPYVDSGMINPSDYSYGIEAVFEGETSYQNVSFSSFSLELESGAKVTCGSKTANVYYDKVKPTCSFSGNTPNGSNGWYKSNATIKATFSDSGSGVLNKGVSTSNNDYNNNESYSLTQNTSGTTIYCSVKDKAGNVGTNSITVKKDDGSSSSCSLTGENSSWKNTDVTLNYSITTSGSGFVSGQTDKLKNAFSLKNDSKVSSTITSSSSSNYTLKSVFSGETSYQNASYGEVSLQLNSGASVTCGSKTANVYYDKVKPTCSFSGNTPNGSNGWYKSNATIKATFSDSGSGVLNKGVSTSNNDYNNNESYSLTQNTNGTTIYCSVKDKAGNVGTNSITVKKDDGSSSSCSLTGENSSWKNTDVTLNYSITTSGSGFVSGQTDKLKNAFSLKNDSKVSSTITSSSSSNYTLKSVFSGETSYQNASYGEVSLQLNSGASVTCGSKTANVYYDKVKPTCSFSGNTPNGSNGWYKSNATIKATFSDSGSGVLNKGVSTSNNDYNNNESYSLTQNTSGTTIYCSVKDKAGNVGSNTINVKKDDGSGTSCVLRGENSNWTNSRVWIQYEMQNSTSGFPSAQYPLGDKMSVYGDYLVDSGAYGSPEDNSFYGLEAIFDAQGEYKTMSFYMWSAELNSGAIAYCPPKTVNVYYDGVKPTCSFEGNTPNGNNFWYKSTANIKATFNDGNGSGIDIYGVGDDNTSSYNNQDTYVLNENTSGKTLTCLVKDKAGNVGSNTIDVRKDDGSGASCVLRGENSNWTNSMVSVSYVANSNLSKFASSQNISSSNISGYAEGGFTGNDSRTEVGLYARYYGTISYKSVSFKGFTAVLESGASVYCGSKDANVYYDGVAPKCSYNENSNWTNKTVTIGNTCSDSASGCAEGVGLNRNINGSSTVKTIKLDNTITDKAGNTTTCSHTYDVYYDPVPPKCNYNENSSWTNKMVTIGNSCSDSDSGCSDNTSWNKSFSGAIVQKTFTNANIISDKAGNTTTCDYTYDVYYDGEAPKCTINVRSTGQYGIFGEVTASDDSGSGLSDSVSQSFANLKYTTNYSFSDNAGNAGSCEVKVDSYNQEQKRTRTYQSCQNASCGWGDWEITTAFGNVCTTDSRPLYDACEFECRGIKLWQRCLKTCSTAECGYNSYGSWTNVSSCSSDDLTECRTVKIYYNPS